MQKAIALFLAALFISLTPLVQAQTEPPIIDYKLKVGDVLTYEIIQHSKKQILKLQLTSVPDGEFDFAKLTFDWTKTGDDINQSGKVQFTGNYMDDYNLSVTSSFRIDFDKLNYSKIFPSQGLWLGVKAQMDILLSGSEFSITLMDDKEQTNYTLENKVYYPATTFNGKPCRIVNGKYKQVSNPDNFMMIQEGDANPLIMAVFIKEKDFLLKLVSIEEGKLNAVAATPAVSAQPVNTTPSIPTVTIGNQTWMVNNLDVSKFRNGDIIPEAKSEIEWNNASRQGQPVWCYYDFDANNGKKYGKMYNGYAVIDKRGLAPENWHIPSKEEWEQLRDFLGGSSAAGNKLRSTDGWFNNINGTNESGFNGGPGGFYVYGFNDIGKYSYWWSSTDLGSNWLADMFLETVGQTMEISGYEASAGFYVRCLKNE